MVKLISHFPVLHYSPYYPRPHQENTFVHVDLILSIFFLWHFRTTTIIWVVVVQVALNQHYLPQTFMNIHIHMSHEKSRSYTIALCQQNDNNWNEENSTHICSYISGQENTWNISMDEIINTRIHLSSNSMCKIHWNIWHHAWGMIYDERTDDSKIQAWLKWRMAKFRLVQSIKHNT